MNNNLMEYDILKKICLERKSCRNFSDNPVSDADIQKILDIAYTSPYATGRKNWEIQVIRDKDILIQMVKSVENKVKEISVDMKEEFKDSFLQYCKNFTFFQNAPVVLIPTFRSVSTVSMMLENQSNINLLQWERDSFTKSISCVSMLILLAAQSIGLNACYLTGPIIAQNEILKLINAKQGKEIGAIIPIGYKN